MTKTRWIISAVVITAGFVLGRLAVYLHAGGFTSGDKSGEQITPEEIKDGSYLEKVKPIAAAEWVANNPVPTVVAYGIYDKLQPFAASKRLKAALEVN